METLYHDVRSLLHLQLPSRALSRMDFTGIVALKSDRANPLGKAMSGNRSKTELSAQVKHKLGTNNYNTLEIRTLKIISLHFYFSQEI